MTARVSGGTEFIEKQQNVTEWNTIKKNRTERFENDVLK